LASGNGSARRPSARQDSVCRLFPSRHAFHGFDGDGHEYLASRERRVLITLATQQTVAKHHHRVPTAEPRAGRQVFCELLGLPWIEAHKEGRDNGPQANTTLNTVGVDAVAQANTVDDTLDQHIDLSPFTSTGRRGMFMPDRVAIEANTGQMIVERFDPRTSFERGHVQVAWDALQPTYFTSCALWTSLTIPFVLTQPGFETEELEPWGEDGEIWRRLRAVFPARIASHSADQLFYSSLDGLLCQHDHRMSLATQPATIRTTTRCSTGLAFPHCGGPSDAGRTRQPYLSPRC